MTFLFRDQENAHELLQQWRKENQDGFMLNCRTASSGMLHRTKCPHFGDEEWERDVKNDLGQKLKVCAMNIATLRDWANSNGIKTISICGDCRPKESIEHVVMEAIELEKNGYFDPKNVADTRSRIAREIACRQGQPAFRRELLKAYERRCAITRCVQVEVLDAAHITPYLGPETNHVQNGLLLRTDIHTLFDLGRMAIDTSDMTVVVHDLLHGSEYMKLSGSPLRVPSDKFLRPSKQALDQQREWAGLPSRST
ncbi:HNH endonuclease [Aphanothece minutissima]|uniref:HNH nuclease domain-containing protein n=1 Tax=Aphanothece cf. minutissima CCALA 015 TaxID=2107695 RepID=A0ABX5F7B1_9CHRO|nr:HNH endonuclease [Aphanothece minutissima]PSB37495.1 hypothetical protein C7B81_08190 [Aphanothece cf. minutissima CCALA 015]